MQLERSNHADHSAPMIDNLALGISHGLLFLAALRLFLRRDLDQEPPPGAPPEPPEEKKGFARRA